MHDRWGSITELHPQPFFPKYFDVHTLGLQKPICKGRILSFGASISRLPVWEAAEYLLYLPLVSLYEPLLFSWCLRMCPKLGTTTAMASQAVEVQLIGFTRNQRCPPIPPSHRFVNLLRGVTGCGGDLGCIKARTLQIRNAKDGLLLILWTGNRLWGSWL